MSINLLLGQFDRIRSANLRLSWVKKLCKADGGKCQTKYVVGCRYTTKFNGNSKILERTTHPDIT